MMRSDRQGFTLIEMMVVIFLSSVILYAVYSFYSASSEIYTMQDQILVRNSNLRFALDHLKRDIGRAGFQTSPNTADDQNVCPKLTDRNLYAVTLEQRPIYANDSEEANHIVPYSITLLGDYASGVVYRTNSISSGGGATVVTLTTFPPNEASFYQVFDPYPGVSCRFLRIINKGQFEIISEIKEANWNGGILPTVTLADEVPLATGDKQCGIEGLGEGLEANVINFIRYRVDFHPTMPDVTALFREELEVDGETPVAAIVIAEYVVDLNFFDFVFDTDQTRSNPTPSGAGVYPTVDKVVSCSGGTCSGKLDTTPGDEAPAPQDLRFLTVKVSVRTPNEDINLTHKRADSTQPLETFDLYLDRKGACYVTSSSTKIEMRSLTVRNLKVL